MLERVGDWRAYLANSAAGDDEEQISKHTRTGRPLGTAEFIRKIENLTGETLVAKQPGPKPKNK